MSRQLLINNATAVPAAAAGVTDPSEVAEGRIAAFNADAFADGTLALDAPLTDVNGLLTVERLVFVQGAASGEEPLISPVFNVRDIKESQVSSKAYVAPVAQVSTVTAATGSGVAYVRVVKVSDGYKPHQRITVEVDLTDKTAADIATELSTKINKAKPSFVTATTGTADLILTADIGVSFETSLDGSAEGWTLVATTAPNFGSGTAAHIAALEEEAFGANFTNRIYLPVSPVKYAADDTYDLFTILIPTNTTPNISNSNKYHELRLAVAATATAIDLSDFFFGQAIA